MAGKSNTSGVAASLDALFEPWNRADQPGLVIGVRHRGEIIYRRAFGMASLESGVANSVRTPLRIGSTSKHFVAVLALQLERAGLLDLEAPIGQYLPELTPPNSLPTVRQLLQHRGGTRCHIDLNLLAHSDFAAPAGSALETLRAQQGINFPPGQATMYNNGGYHLVSLAASRVTQTSLADLLARYLFEPLGMSHSALVVSDYLITPGIATFHMPGAQGGWRRGLFCSNEILGEGGIVSTVDDMLIWAKALHSTRLLGDAPTLDLLTDAPPEIDGEPGYYGLGMMERTYRGATIFSHPGGVFGGSADLLMIPGHELDVVILLNGAPNAIAYVLTERVVDIVLAEQLAPPAVYPAPEDYRDWLGVFGSRTTGMVYSLEDLRGSLYLKIAQYTSPFRLEYTSTPQGWLTTSISGLSKVRVRSERRDDGTPLIRVRNAGREDLLELLTPFAADPVGIEGRFESAESGIFATIERVDGQLLLTLRDRWGIAHFDLLPAGGQWLTMRSRPDMHQFWATLWFPDGWAGDPTLNSARTRNLSFKRLRA